MDLSDIPFGVPVILQSLSDSLSLQNPHGSIQATCMNNNRDVYEQMILHRVGDTVTIESARNGRFLQVDQTGECVFGTKVAGEAEHFKVETNCAGALIFVPTNHTYGCNLACDSGGIVYCGRQRGVWKIVAPMKSC
ncbi:hypothetical protein PHMEG_00025126 [Phytophthora megakarya]|uniref:Uncharacterized protein n=1 Tax=Phytophthora megakarya TaxID=4795 RepID=A0A225VBW3_9STRA|nr:hypothetical protein PHMEG_00025126 [Phytophthora megakarya]